MMSAAAPANSHPGESMTFSNERAQSPTLLSNLFQSPNGLFFRPRSCATLVCCLALALACAAPPDKYTAADIQQATQSGDLSSLYDQIEADLKDPAHSEKQRQTMELRLADAGRTLAGEAEKQVEAAIAASALPDGLVPINAYEAQKGQLESVERWDVGTFQRLSSQLSDGEAKTQAAISKNEALLEALTDSQAQEKLALFEELGALHGAGTDEQEEYAEQGVATLRELGEAADRKSVV